MLYAYDKKILEEYKLIAGVDEAGRGPLAGNVYAAAVILDYDNPIVGIKDSKKLSEKKREKLYEEIIEKAVDFNIAYATVEEIDELNILKATMLAMERAVEGLNYKPELVLIDGISKPQIENNVKLIKKGDNLSASIAAASILAKVTRDTYIRGLDKIYPEYHFAQHKGYGTKLHYEMLDKYDCCEIHRQSFLRKWRQQRLG